VNARINMDTFKEFYLKRIEDENGISGTGIVARGVVLPSGKAVLEWQTFHTSLCIYNNIQDVEAIHGHGGKTLLIMGCPNQEEKSKPVKKKTTKTAKE
jgi:hypothetical protein